MAEIIDLSKLPREEAVKMAMELFKFTRSEAEFYTAISRGEIDGDIVEIIPGVPEEEL